MGAGILSLRQAKAPSQRFFAAIPILFSLQQMSEGFLWLSLTHESLASWYFPSMYFYFLIAMSVWPVWVPFSIWKMEEVPKRRRQMNFSLVSGIAASVYFLIFMLTDGVSANVDCYHVAYLCDYPFKNVANLLYVIAVALPFFISSWKNMPILGLCAIGSLTAAQVFFHQFSLSVWCFFAAWLAVMFYWVMAVNTNPKNSTTPSRYPKTWLPD